MEDVTLHLLKVDKAKKPSQCKEWIFIIKNNVIHAGNWMDNIDGYLQGLVQGLEICNLKVKVNIMEIKNDEAYDRVSSGDINLEYLETLC